MIRLEIMPGRWHCRALAGAAAAGLMTLVAIVSPQQARSADVATAAPIQVSIEKFKFIPPEVTVPVGATVVWVNRDEEAHLVAAREKQFESSPLDQGDTFSMTFDKPGKYPYFCLVHPQMIGLSSLVSPAASSARMAAAVAVTEPLMACEPVESGAGEVITRLTRPGESGLPAAIAAKRVRELVLPHLNAGYNLARWLTGTDQDAGDVVHEAFLRALRYADSYSGGNACAWWLAIVRTSCFRLLAEQRRFSNLSFDDIDERAAVEAAAATAQPSADPETEAHQSECRHLLVELIALLPPEFREVVVLRELEGCHYSEIAEIIGVPIGTVMSRLARGRRLLRKGWTARNSHGGHRSVQASRHPPASGSDGGVGVGRE